MALKCNIIPVNDPGLFMVDTSTSSYIVHVVTDDLYDKEQVLLELCRAIVSLEKKGAIVTSVQEICVDGRRPRVAFRQSKAYKKAKTELPNKKV